MPSSGTNAIVIGWGHTLRGDDAAGHLVAERLGAEALPGVRVETTRLLTPELAHDLSRSSVAVLVDADADADDVVVREVEPSHTVRGAVTHALTAGQLLALCETAYGVRPRAWLVGVPGEQYELGAPLSARTGAAVEIAVNVVRELLAAEDPASAAEAARLRRASPSSADDAANVGGRTLGASCPVEKSRGVHDE